jgi:hypothetical protein
MTHTSHTLAVEGAARGLIGARIAALAAPETVAAGVVAGIRPSTRAGARREDFLSHGGPRQGHWIVR